MVGALEHHAHVLGERADVPLAGSGAHQHGIGDAGLVLDVDRYDVDTLQVIERIGGEAQNGCAVVR